MTLFDAIVVGSGPAGTFAAYSLQGTNTLMLDVGYRPPASPGLDGNIFKLRKSEEDLFSPLIGKDFESLHNLYNRNISLKLKAPYLSYVIKDWDTLSPVKSDNFAGVYSFAKGGLANAWGAGVFRFNDSDLRDFPVKALELEPYYERLASHIGICGLNDDLEPFFGYDDKLMEPLRISRFATNFLDRYRNKRRFFNEQGIYVGRNRLAVLSDDHNHRKAYKYENLEFFKPCISAVYNPVYTLDEMLEKQTIKYLSGYLVVTYEEHETFVEVKARHLESGAVESFKAKKLILAAGALNTAKIVLTSNEDYESKLQLLDNPIVVMPMLRLGAYGSELEIEGSSLGQLVVVYDGPLATGSVQASLFGTNGPLRSDVLFDLPLPLSGNISLLKYASQSTGALMIFYPGRPIKENYVKINKEGAIEVHCKDEELPKIENVFMRAFRKIGYYSASFLCQYPKMGTGLHYAGMLPMKETPCKYETDKMGRLFGTSNVFVADGACFTALPSKNLTFTIMANSMRIADFVKSELGG